MSLTEQVTQSATANALFPDVVTRGIAGQQLTNPDFAFAVAAMLLDEGTIWTALSDEEKAKIMDRAASAAALSLSDLLAVAFKSGGKPDPDTVPVSAQKHLRRTPRTLGRRWLGSRDTHKGEPVVKTASS